MKDFMFDLETLGTGSNALVTQIGACFFDIETGQIDRKFFVNIDINESIKRGFEIDADTLFFWFKQPAENRTFLEDPISIDSALRLFRSASWGCERVWSHSIFDYFLLDNLHKKTGKKITFDYRKCRDIRTLIDLAEFEREKEARVMPHDALSDCIYQVGYCSKAFKKLKGKHGNTIND